MTRDEFIDRWKHEISGMMCDAAMAGRTGGELAIWLRKAMKTIDSKLGQMYTDMKQIEVIKTAPPIKPVAGKVG